MKKAVILLIAMVSVLVSGCAYVPAIEPTITKEYTYIGENKNWTGEYVVNYLVTFPKKDGKVYAYQKENDTLMITYKGDISDLSTVKHSEISYKHSSGGGTSTTDYDSPLKSKKFRLGGGSGSKSQIDEYPMTSERMQSAFKLYGGSYTASFDEKIEVDINLDGNIEHLELLPIETSELASLDFEQINTDLSRIRLTETYISHINHSGLDLKLIHSKATIQNEKNLSDPAEPAGGKIKGQELITPVLYYEFTIKKVGNKTVGRIKSLDDIQIKIIPHEKLKKVSEEIYGINRFETDSDIFKSGLGYGLSMEGDFLNTNKECVVTLTCDLSTNLKDLLASQIRPSADQLEKLERNALNATLLILYKDTEIARFNLNEE